MDSIGGMAKGPYGCRWVTVANQMNLKLGAGHALHNHRVLHKVEERRRRAEVDVLMGGNGRRGSL